MHVTALQIPGLDVFVPALAIAAAVAFVVHKKVYKPLMAKIDAIAQRRNPEQTFDPVLQNELDYAGYIEWAAQNNFTAHIKKQSLTTGSGFNAPKL